MVVGKFKAKHPELNNIKFGQIIGYTTLFLVLCSGYKLATSPLTRPILVDTSFKSEQEDLSGTPLLDEVIK